MGECACMYVQVLMCIDRCMNGGGETGKRSYVQVCMVRLDVYRFMKRCVPASVHAKNR